MGVFGTYLPEVYSNRLADLLYKDLVLSGFIKDEPKTIISLVMSARKDTCDRIMYHIEKEKERMAERILGKSLDEYREY